MSSIIALVLAVALGWFACGFVAAGFLIAYSQREFPRLAEKDFDRDLGHAFGMALLGPAALLTVLFMGLWVHGWTLGSREEAARLTREARRSP
jgi:hypothetical protein